MNDFTYMWLMMACITLVMIFAQGAINVENPDGPVYLNGTNVVSRHYTSVGQLDDTNPYEDLPDASSGESSENDYTDEYRVSQSWLGSLVGNNYLGDVLSSPFNIFKAMGLPSTISNIIGAFWWGFLLLLTAMMLIGKEK